MPQIFVYVYLNKEKYICEFIFVTSSDFKKSDMVNRSMDKFIVGYFIYIFHLYLNFK